VTGEWRKLHNEELRYFYSSPSIIIMIKSRRMRWRGMCHGRTHISYLVGHPEGNRPLGRPGHRCVDNIKRVLEICYVGMHCINVTQDMGQWRALVNTVMILRVQ
jgi:hypothetical protein